MTALFGQVAFVVWRESTEAILVVGILQGWLAHHAGAKVATARRFLWAGVAAGLGGALLLAGAILFLETLLDGERADYFQIGMAALAALLILQMVVWMHRQGRGLKPELERGAERAVTAGNWVGLFLLAAIAVMREGNETVVFLYGVLASARQTTLPATLAAVAAGFATAAASYWLIHVAAKRFPWTVFFRVGEVLLLFLAGSLLMTALDRTIGLELVPPLSGAIWDTSWLLDDTGGLGGLVANMTGYRARPELATILAYAIYWIAVLALLRSPRPHRTQACP
ncbi:MAG: FTR1 family iron permease [Mesorhizobium sp.]|uniref:FTR1 family iron permease n=1 Tax=Mesorhizobium sp. TaxID=1871066 RepID=UPI0011FCE2E2|nr:FTR1 family protein [Mesorhizobium sp.]TIO52823.1 MAG: FTR1 family iron permease [Mesorhizobium sp.]TIO59537.1 MAG: FTR1 family iron permease [Mesorhizobium sp.]TJV62974.1 MAG: FTR1 family iron permease [Mesorhizobium sp.]